MNNGLFVEAYRKVCNAYNRESKPDQAQFFFNELNWFGDECVPIAVEALIELGKIPNLKDWKAAFYDARRKTSKVDVAVDKPDKCPRCGNEGINPFGGDLCDENGVPVKGGERITFVKCLSSTCSYQETYRTYRARLYGRI